MKSWFLRSKRADIQLSNVAKGNFVVCDRHFLPSQMYAQCCAGQSRARIKEGEIPQPDDGRPCINSRSKRLLRRKVCLFVSCLQCQLLLLSLFCNTAMHLGLGLCSTGVVFDINHLFMHCYVSIFIGTLSVVIIHAQHRAYCTNPIWDIQPDCIFTYQHQHLLNITRNY